MRRLLLFLVFPLLATADVRLPAILGDHMALQAQMPLHFWGWADPGEKVEVKFRGQSASTTAEADGRWSLYLNPEAAGGPDTVEIAGRNRIRLDDVLVGEVWVGSGQSNMVFPVKNANDADKEIAAASFPEIRIFKVKLETASEPKQDVEGEWVACSPQTAGDISGVGYFFSRDLHQKLGGPIGFIQSAWGGTPAQAWTPYEELDGDPALHQVIDIGVRRSTLTRARWCATRKLSIAGRRKPQPLARPGRRPRASRSRHAAPATSTSRPCFTTR
ncbi:MAG: sialate O-acetylesterase [Bryobacterales bacterium]